MAYELPLCLKVGEGDASKKTYNGFEFTVTGVERVMIPALPGEWIGRSKAFTTCRNYQFGVRYHGQGGQ